MSNTSNNEAWKPLVGSESHYAVSDKGRIKRTAPGRQTKPGRLRHPAPAPDGYEHVCLSVNGQDRTVTVHQAVTRAFLGPCPQGMEVNHKDGDKRNNLVQNLEYVTRSENQRHAYRLGLMSRKGEFSNRAKLNNWIVRIIRRCYDLGSFTQAQLADLWNIHRSTIGYIVTRRMWPHI